MARYLSHENNPYGRWKGLPIYLTTILAALLVVGLFVSAFLMSARSSLLLTLTFQLPGGASEVLAVVTYPFIDRVTFFTPFAILFFYWLAVGIETHLGRKALACLLALLVLTPVAVSAIAWWGFGIPTLALGIGQFGLSGTFLLSCALLIAFATLYPHAEWLGWVPFKWVAFACIVCGSLMQVAANDWLGLAGLWASCLVAYLYISRAVEAEYDDREPLSATFRKWFTRKPRLRVLPRPSRAMPRQLAMPKAELGEPDSAEEEDEEVDALLDKIARSGLASLTPAERARLEKAREALLRKEQR